MENNTRNIENLHLIPGITGCGKTTIARHLARTIENADMVVGYTTRPPRPGEIDGVDYYFRDKKHLRDVEKGIYGDDWRISKFNNEYYYNSDSNTLPNITNPIRILPVAWNALEEVIGDYSEVMSSNNITVGPIVISRDIEDKWMRAVEPLRPGRDLVAELGKQALNLYSINFDMIYNPIWELQKDSDNYTRLFRSLIATKYNKQ